MCIIRVSQCTRILVSYTIHISIRKNVYIRLFCIIRLGKIDLTWLALVYIIFGAFFTLYTFAHKYNK